MASNPYRYKKQRQEWEVKALLEKIQPDLISLNPTCLTKIDHVTADQLEKDRIERLVCYYFITNSVFYDDLFRFRKWFELIIFYSFYSILFLFVAYIIMFFSLL